MKAAGAITLAAVAGLALWAAFIWFTLRVARAVGGGW
jgi:hypothetical protein